MSASRGSSSAALRRGVFLSSTSVDLEPYRSRVASLVQTLGQFAVTMDKFPLQPALDATSVSLSELGKSDLYILLLAWRYGYIPDGQELAVTHQEYREARRLGLPCFVFLADPRTDTDPALYPPEVRDPEHREQLLAFRSEVEQQQLVAYFTSREDLADKAAAALHQYMLNTQPTNLGQSDAGPPYDLALLPVPAHFVGREQELAFLRRRLMIKGSTSGIAAVNGMGGIGKTGLAAKVIRELHEQKHFPGGIVVALCQDKISRADALQILSDVLTRFDRQRHTPDVTDYAGLAEAAQRLLRGKEALVVLDNVEPGLPVAFIITPLREAGTTVLLTARQKQPPDVVPLEGRLALDLLSELEALDLVAQSLGYEGPSELSSDELDAATRLVEALGRHTLAVKLAAAYVADGVGVTLKTLAEQVRDPQRALQLPKGEAPSEVQRIFAMSFTGLQDDAQRLFAALAVFPTAEFGLEATVALAGELDVADPIRTTELLVRRALVSLQAERVRIHPLMQALAAVTFAEWPAQTRKKTELAVGEYYAEYANAQDGLALVADESNIIGAIGWSQANGEDKLLIRLCYGMRSFWRNTGRTSMTLQYLPWAMKAATRIASATSERGDKQVVIDITEFYGDALMVMGDLEKAQTLYQRDLTMAQDLLDPEREANAILRLGQVARARGDLGEAHTYLQKALVISRRAAAWRVVGVILNDLGLIAHDRGRLEEAEGYFTHSIAIKRKIGDRVGESASLNNLGRLMFEWRRHTNGMLYLQQALSICREVGHRRVERAVLNNLGFAARLVGDLEEAQRWYEQSLELARETGEANVEDELRFTLADLQHERSMMRNPVRLMSLRG